MKDFKQNYSKTFTRYLTCIKQSDFYSDSAYSFERNALQTKFYLACGHFLQNCPRKAKTLYVIKHTGLFLQRCVGWCSRQALQSATNKASGRIWVMTTIQQ
jgi:hypothetical protein